MRGPEIYCPLCAWQPTSTSLWMCSRQLGGCGCVWNTFDTRGICPKCSNKWEITACLSCGRFSLHEHWYHDPKTPRTENGKDETGYDAVVTSADVESV
jgi:hypothetical protein